MPNESPISVVIRSRTDSDLILRAMDRLRAQRPTPAEIIVIDSGSAPRIVEELARRADRFIRIAPEAFTSAGALNQAIAEARGDLIAIMSHDALPRGEDYLARLAAAFDSPCVAGAYGRQVARPNDHPLNEKDLSKTYPPRSRTQTNDCWFDNCCSMIRADLWRRHAFDERAVISEDHAWAKWALSEGFVIQYVAEAVVEHSHPRQWRRTYARFYQEGLGLAHIHAPRRLSAPHAVFCWAREVASDLVWLARRGRFAYLWTPFAERAAKHLALYRGWRDGRAAMRQEKDKKEDCGCDI